MKNKLKFVFSQLNPNPDGIVKPHFIIISEPTIAIAISTI